MTSDPDGEWEFTPTARERSHKLPRLNECGLKERSPKLYVAEIAGKQCGRIRWDQLLGAGASRSTVCRWVADGYLHPELPRVYAVGHHADSVEGSLAAALLYAGPGAALSHATAAWWWGLLKYGPSGIQVSTPRQVRAHGGIVVYGRRRVDRIVHNDLPVTTVSQTLLDYAATGKRKLLRLALANADYDDLLDLDELQRLMGMGIAGTAALREALKLHLPQLACTRGDLEILLLDFCQSHRIRVPEVNVYVEGWLVDAYWPDRRLVVEVNGWRGHRTPAQLQRDHQRDLELRLAGYVVLRYTWRQLTEAPALVAAELRRYL